MGAVCGALRLGILTLLSTRPHVARTTATQINDWLDGVLSQLPARCTPVLTMDLNDDGDAALLPTVFGPYHGRPPQTQRQHPCSNPGQPPHDHSIRPPTTWPHLLRCNLELPNRSHSPPVRCAPPYAHCLCRPPRWRQTATGRPQTPHQRLPCSTRSPTLDTPCRTCLLL